jgi:hypothetical protein
MLLIVSRTYFANFIITKRFDLGVFSLSRASSPVLTVHFQPVKTPAP